MLTSSLTNAILHIIIMIAWYNIISFSQLHQLSCIDYAWKTVVFKNHVHFYCFLVNYLQQDYSPFWSYRAQFLWLSTSSQYTCIYSFETDKTAPTYFSIWSANPLFYAWTSKAWLGSWLGAYACASNSLSCPHGNLRSRELQSSGLYPWSHGSLSAVHGIV